MRSFASGPAITRLAGRLRPWRQLLADLSRSITNGSLLCTHAAAHNSVPAFAWTPTQAGAANNQIDLAPTALITSGLRIALGSRLPLDAILRHTFTGDATWFRETFFTVDGVPSSVPSHDYKRPLNATAAKT